MHRVFNLGSSTHVRGCVVQRNFGFSTTMHDVCMLVEYERSSIHTLCIVLTLSKYINVAKALRCRVKRKMMNRIGQSLGYMHPSMVGEHEG